MLAHAVSVCCTALQTYQGALDMLENVYIKTGGTSKCFGTDSGGHGSGETIALEQGEWLLLLLPLQLLLQLLHAAAVVLVCLFDGSCCCSAATVFPQVHVWPNAFVHCSLCGVWPG